MSSAEPVIRHEDDCDLEGGDGGSFGRVTWRTLISADRTPTNEMTVGIAEIPPGVPHEVGRHRHEQAEAYYILEGDGTVIIGDTEYRVGAGSVAFIPSNTWHVAQNTGAVTLRILYVFATDTFSDVVYEFERLTGERR